MFALRKPRQTQNAQYNQPKEDVACIEDALTSPNDFILHPGQERSEAKHSYTGVGDAYEKLKEEHKSVPTGEGKHEVNRNGQQHQAQDGMLGNPFPEKMSDDQPGQQRPGGINDLTQGIHFSALMEVIVDVKIDQVKSMYYGHHEYGMTGNTKYKKPRMPAEVGETGTQSLPDGTCFNMPLAGRGVADSGYNGESDRISDAVQKENLMHIPGLDMNPQHITKPESSLAGVGQEEDGKHT